MSLFEVCIMTPDEILLDSKDVKELVLPTTTGRMGVLANHSPLVTGLEIGVMLVGATENLQWSSIALLGGFALIKDNKVTVVVSGATLGSDINPEEAEKVLEAAKSKVDKAQDRKDKIESNLALKRARANYEASQTVK